MLIPLCTSTPSHRVPVVVVTLILLTGVVHLRWSSQPNATLAQWGFQARPGILHDLAFFQDSRATMTLVSYAFVHGSWFHVLGNLWVLLVFGCPVESRIGHIQFLVLYITCAGFSAVSHVALCADSTSTIIGASGAVSGVLGCLLALEPRSRFLSFVFLGFCGFIAEIPGLFYMLIWLIYQCDGLQRQLVSQVDSEAIAWSAHLGGAALGVAIGLVLRAFARRRQQEAGSRAGDVV